MKSGEALEYLNEEIKFVREAESYNQKKKIFKTIHFS